MTLHTKQQGSTLLAVILVALMVAIVGISGWYVWSKNNQGQPSQQSQSPANTQSSQNTPTDDRSESGKYLVIKEWGVRMKLAEDVEDAYYFIDPKRLDYAYLSTKTKSEAQPACAADKTSIAAISRLIPGQDALDSLPDSVRIGGYFYEFEYSHTNCALGIDLISAFKTLEQIP